MNGFIMGFMDINTAIKTEHEQHEQTFENWI